MLHGSEPALSHHETLLNFDLSFVWVVRATQRQMTGLLNVVTPWFVLK